MNREKPHKLLQVGVTPTPATILRLEPEDLPRIQAKDVLHGLGEGGRPRPGSKLWMAGQFPREVIRLPDCKSGVRKQSRK